MTDRGTAAPRSGGQQCIRPAALTSTRGGSIAQIFMSLMALLVTAAVYLEVERTLREFRSNP
jgi:hypothetical protein